MWIRGEGWGGGGSGNVNMYFFLVFFPNLFNGRFGLLDTYLVVFATN